MTELRELLARGLGLVDRPLRLRLALLSVAALGLSTLDAVGVLLVVPLVEVMNGNIVELPLLGASGPGPIMALVVGLFVAKSVAMAGLRWWVLGVSLRASSRAATSTYERLLRAPLRFHDPRNTAESVRLVVVSIRNFFEQGVIGAANLVAESASVLVLCSVLLTRSPGAGLVTFGYLTSAMMIYARLVQRRTIVHARRTEHLTGRSVQMVQEALGALPELHVRGTADYLVRPFEETMEQVARSRRRITFASEFGRYYLEIVFFGAVGVVATFVLASEPTDAAMATLAVFVVVGFRILLSLARVLSATNRIRVGRAALDLVAADLAAIDTVGAAPNRSASGPVAGGAAEIEVDRVGFKYEPGGPSVLDDVCLRVPAGGIAGIVGSSGSGKSTLLELICGLREPTAGRVIVTGVGVPGQPRVGYVPQTVFTLDSTVRDNVALGGEADDEDIWSSLRAACLDDFVRQLPGQLNEPVGEAGARLSGGQRQRLGMARAYLLSPGLLILDEATSALDGATEAQVLERLRALDCRPTVIIVTHRPSTLGECDATYRLVDGRLEPLHLGDQEIELQSQLAGEGLPV